MEMQAAPLAVQRREEIRRKNNLTTSSHSEGTSFLPGPARPAVPITLRGRVRIPPAALRLPSRQQRLVMVA